MLMKWCRNCSLKPLLFLSSSPDLLSLSDDIFPWPVLSQSAEKVFFYIYTLVLCPPQGESKQILKWFSSFLPASTCDGWKCSGGLTISGELWGFCWGRECLGYSVETASRVGDLIEHVCVWGGTCVNLHVWASQVRCDPRNRCYSLKHLLCLGWRFMQLFLLG